MMKNSKGRVIIGNANLTDKCDIRIHMDVEGIRFTSDDYYAEEDAQEVASQLLEFTESQKQLRHL